MPIDKMKDNSFKLTKERSRRYLAQTIMDTDYADDIALLVNIPVQAEILLHSLEWATAGIDLNVNTHKIEYMCFNQRGDISTLNSSSLKLVDKFTYLGSSVSSTQTDINTWLAKAWIAIDMLSVIWKSDLTDRMKLSFFPSICVNTAVWMHYWDANFRKKAWQQLHKNAASNTEQVPEQDPTKQQLYGHLPPITKTIQVRRTRHVG